MASQKEIGLTYNFMDQIFRLSLGENADFSGSMYNGDFSMTLEEAQENKHRYIIRNLRLRKGDRVLDIGSGWGPMLKALQDRGFRAIGLTLSTAQAEACRHNGLEAYVRDWNNIDVNTFGKFDGIVSLGAFEHFCSKEEFLAGKQDQIYDKFFKLCHDILPKGGRLYLQTMLFGKKMIDYRDVSVKASKGSDAQILGLMEKVFPGSWLPRGEEHVIKVAAPYFKVVSLNNGRKDYIETINQWGKKMTKFSFKKLFLALGLVRNFFIDKDFWYRMESMFYNPNQECFKRELFDHQRMVFQRRD